jgi:serine/threonine protein kinase
MTLSTGTKLGRYEIRSQLGAGGMGEVYRARDEKLNRDVAIKVLPPQYSQDQNRLHRFEQEAQAAGQLNHPNILAIYDVGIHENAPYVVSELLEGQVLRDRLRNGSLPQRKAVDYALQVARGLSAAHERKLVHRDIKPENVFITHDERLKILDFGLVKLRETFEPDQPQTDVPTRRVNTTPGVAVGTVGYMSPEQVRGDGVDHRTDIFAVGVILYEMLAGDRAFRGNSEVETLNAILKDDPPEFTSAKTISPSLERIMRRCLEKNPEERFQSARDLAFALEALSDPAGSTPKSSGPSKTRRFGREGVVALVACLFLFTTLILLFLYIRRTTTDAYSSRFQISPPENLTLATADLLFPVAVSPSGRQLALVLTGDGRTSLWLRPLDSLTAVPFDKTDGARNPFWSPDGRFIGFFADGKLKKIAASGGVPEIICDAPPNTNSGTWSQDGTILFTVGQLEKGILRVSANGGPVTEVSKPDPLQRENYHFWPQFLPDGRHFFFLGGKIRREESVVYLASVDDGEPKRVLQASSRVMYAPPGYLLYVREGTLLAQAFDTASLSLTGEQITIAEQVGNFSPTGNAYFSVSANGEVLAYQAGGSTSRLVWLNRTGTEESAVGTPADYLNPRLSPDGQKIAVNIIDPKDGTNDLWIYELSRATLTRFTFTPGMENGSAWSPDSKRLVFAHDQDGPPHLFLKALGETGDGEMLLSPNEGPQLPQDWSADGQFLIYRGFFSPTRSDLFILPMAGERKPFAFANTSFLESEARFSPNGRWVAYVSDESGRREIYVRRSQGVGERIQISNSGGSRPRWSHDGRELFYVAADQKLIAVPVSTGDQFEAGNAVALFKIEARASDFDVAPDGKRFLVNSTVDAPKRPLSVVTGWASNIKR